MHVHNIGKRSDFIEDKPKVVRPEGKGVVIWRKNGQLHAFDQKCPHEGYPLSLGSVNGQCQLTCHWHQWKFNLKNGENLYGGDQLATYPIHEDEDIVWLDLTPRSPAVLEEKLHQDILQGMEDRDYGRLGRTLTKLHLAGLDPAKAVNLAIKHTSDRFEYGMTHAHAGMLAWYKVYLDQTLSPEIRIAALNEGIDILAYDTLREPQYPYTSEVGEWDRIGFIQAIEKEDEAHAIALVNGALSHNVTFDVVYEVLVEAVLQHYRGFGHGLIYLNHIPEMLEVFGDDLWPCLLRLLVRRLCYMTKEDLIPDFKDYARAISQSPDFGATVQTIKMPHKLNIGKALDWTLEHMGKTKPEAIWASLSRRAYQNLLDYQPEHGFRFDQKVKDNVDWLDFTHATTFSQAVYEVCRTFPKYWKPGLLQMACFVGRVAPYLSEKPQLAKDNQEIPIEAFIDHGIDPPIYPVHFIKTWQAGKKMRQLLPEEDGLINASIKRYISSPMRQKRVLRTIHQAFDLIT